MTVKVLNGILANVSLPKMEAELMALGYRNASKNGKWEFNPIAIANADSVKNSRRYVDKTNGICYVADIHNRVKEHPNVEFIVVTVKEIYIFNGEIKEQPLEMFLYTDAPINEEYEREQARLSRCTICGIEFRNDELCEVNGKLLCDKCFEAELNKLKKQILRGSKL